MQNFATKKKTLIGNQGKMKKKSFLSPSPPPPRKNLKGKKRGTLNACLGLPIWLHEISLPKFFIYF